MKLLIKYFDVWGTSVQLYININSKGQILDLKKALAHHTDIPLDQLKVTLVSGENQFQLVDDQAYLSDYPFSQHSTVYVGRESDEFSQDFQQDSKSSGSESFKQDQSSSSLIEPPELSIETISVKQSFTDQTLEDPFKHYTINDFRANLLSMVDAIKQDDMDSCRLISQNHKGRLRQLLEETKDESDRDQLKDQMDLLNDIQVTGWTVAHFASFCGRPRFLMWFLSEGCDISKPTKDDWDCLTLAIWQCQYEG